MLFSDSHQQHSIQQTPIVITLNYIAHDTVYLKYRICPIFVTSVYTQGAFIANRAHLFVEDECMASQLSLHLMYFKVKANTQGVCV